MRLFKKHDDEVKRKLINRLRNTSTQELLRWTDNILMGMGRDLTEMRKSLSHADNTEQALVYMADAHTGAVSLMAALHVLEERVNQA